QPESPAALNDMLWRTAIILQPIEWIPIEGDKEIRPALSGGEGRQGGHGTLSSSRPLLISPSSWPSFVDARPLLGAPADDLPAILGADEAALALFQVGWAALMQGLLNDAEPCLLCAYTLALETSQAAVAVVSALQLAHLSALRGHVDATLRWITTSLDTAQQ